MPEFTGTNLADTGVGAVIWDLDGVLVDSEPLLLEAERIAFAEHGVTLTPELKRPFVGLGGAEVLAAMAEEFGLDVDLGALAARKVAAYLELTHTLAGFAATTQLVGRLAAADVPMADPAELLAWILGDSTSSLAPNAVASEQPTSRLTHAQVPDPPTGPAP